MQSSNKDTGKKRKNEEIEKKEITKKKAKISEEERSSSSVIIVNSEAAKTSIDNYQELTSDIKEFEKLNSPSQLATNVKLEYCNFLSQQVSRSIYNPRFIVFGSSLNGFSTRSSDLDITLLIEGEELYQDPLRKVYRRLRKITSKISRCQLIHAKVPIVMFEDLQFGFEVDISINNDSGIRNTFLLRTYSRLDTRVRPLVIVIKEWAKANNVCNSKSGLLSSYALNLMVLFFLQHNASPRVLPSLQRMFPGIFNSYYTIDDIQKVGLQEICNSWKSENTESVGELLIKFFEFYSMLDFREKLISIRTGSIHQRPVWDSARGYKGYINIEEPYTLDNAARSVYLLIRCKEIISEFKRKHKQLMSIGKPKNLDTVFSVTTY
ncbi:Poly(A) RNA polymerase GLD2-like [Oopsacas minuta]|uniref:Poly(A) RNA polymerase GLD2-like n=1 Tax=Oopsacas minuta TaxID=111878 RepID=A0AAV7JDV9_9METZ|nr:Poly(A) RNA polymerase GLD2-like [Oopsacas minuta]